jgi:hypothetical protein
MHFLHFRNFRDDDRARPGALKNDPVRPHIFANEGHQFLPLIVIRHFVRDRQTDVPFDVKHVRVIYYEMTDPFWGTKLIDKVAENILSALKNPNEAVLFGK